MTFAYISDAHDDPATELASGPGQADYVARLATYNEAWGKFFARLTADGVTKDNALFVITADEGAPQRTPTFVLFGNPDYYFQTTGTPDFVENPGFAWNHGGLDHKVNTTFLGMVGPGGTRFRRRCRAIALARSGSDDGRLRPVRVPC